MQPEATIQGMQQALTGGTQTAVSLTRYYLRRIELLDGVTRAVLRTNPQALEEAAASDERRRQGTALGGLDGIPILLKDNIDTVAPLGNTAGSPVLLAPPPSADAFIVQRLRARGAIVLGKTNLSEWANFRGARSSSGWSTLGGQTRNPYALDRSPSGSSSGSAVAVAANLCAAAVGTETDGSIVSPASVNGIVGIKPTVGLLSRQGIVPIAGAQDTAGPMARTVTDAAILLGGMVGVDAGDPATEIAAGAPSDYTPYLDPTGLDGARIGLAQPFLGRDERVDAIVHAAAALLRDAGVTVIEVSTPDVGDFGEAERHVLLYEFRREINRYLAQRDVPGIATLDDLIAFNRREAERTMPFFGQQRFEAAAAVSDDVDEYEAALALCRRTTDSDGLRPLFDDHQLDAIIAPTTGPAWMIDWVNGDAGNAVSSSSLAAVSGFPSITLPAGFVRGLPIGLSFIGLPLTEPALIRLAFAFEQRAPVRQAPSLRPTVAGDAPLLQTTATMTQ